MNLGYLRRACQLRTGWIGSEYHDQWHNFINEAIREFARVQPWQGLEDVLTVSTDGTEYVILPPFVDSIVHILNKSQHIPVDRAGDWDREASAIYSQRTTGRVLNYDKLGIVPALRDPTGFIWLQSTHASDLGALYISGRVANSGASGTGLQATIRTLSLNGTGTSPLTLSTLFTSIISISKTTDANGDFFFYDAGNFNKHISFLGRYDSQAEFKRIQLLYKPAEQTLLEIRFRHKISPLKDDAQAPHPAVKPDYVINHAIALHHAEQDQLAKAQNQEQKALKVLQDESNKEQNFDEPWSQIVPQQYDDDPDTYGDGYWRLS